MKRNYERCKASQQEKLCHFHFNTKCKQKNMHVNLIRKMKMLVCCCYDRGETGTETTYRDVRRTRRLTVTFEIPFSNSSSSSGSSHHWDGWLTLCSFFFYCKFSTYICLRPLRLIVAYKYLTSAPRQMVQTERLQNFRAKAREKDRER